MFFKSNDYHNDNSPSFPYNIALLLIAISTIIYLIRIAESHNRLHYDNRLARILSGLLRMVANNWHTKSNDIEITDTTRKIFAIGPHQTGLIDASVVISKMTGTPPSFFVTDAFNHIPGVAAFINLSKGILVKSDKKFSESVKADVLKIAGKVLDENGCIAIFPQGNFTKLGKEPPRIYEGTAKLALRKKTPIHVIRLDGFWCMENWLLPVFIRNNSYYRAFLSALHMNNIRVMQCDVIDFHCGLGDHICENEDSQNYKEVINEICAQLYAYFRHTNNLTTQQIGVIKDEIGTKMHLTIWESKLKQVVLEKKLSAEKKEEAKLSEPTFLAMRNR